MKKLVLVNLLSISTLFCCAQNPKIQKLKSLNLTTIGVTYDYEHPVTNTASIIISGGLAYSFVKYKNLGDGYEFENYTTPNICFETRRYYNLEKRSFFNKNTSLNGANFLSLHLGYVFTSLPNDPNIISGPYILPSWGMQRSVGQSFRFEFKAGLYFYSFSEPLQEKPFMLGLALNAKFGFVFGQKKMQKGLPN